MRSLLQTLPEDAAAKQRQGSVGGSLAEARLIAGYYGRVLSRILAGSGLPTMSQPQHANICEVLLRPVAFGPVSKSEHSSWFSVSVPSFLP